MKMSGKNIWKGKQIKLYYLITTKPVIKIKKFWFNGFPGKFV